MHSEQLSLQHKELLAPRLRGLGLNISEYTFANLYLFRNIHQYEVVFAFDIFIKGKTRDGFSYLMPTTPIAQLDQQQLIELLTGVDFLYPLPEEWAGCFDPQLFSIEANEDDSDYLYSTEKMRTYPGRHLAGRRNLVKQFKAHYTVRSFPLTSEHIAKAQEVLKQWLEDSRQRPEETDFEACKEALQLLDILGLTGCIYYADEKPIGFMLGEPLNAEVYVMHFAKTNVLYKGIYQFMYQSFALNLDVRYHALNLEQDLGEPGLQQAKRAYLPDKLLPKLRIRRLR